MNDSTFTGNPSTVEYQWWRCDRYGTNCVPIEGATEETYNASETDVDHSLLRCEMRVSPSGTPAS